MIERNKSGKGWSRARTFAKEENAMKYAQYLEPKFFNVAVAKGKKGKAWGQEHEVYRVWVK